MERTGEKPTNIQETTKPKRIEAGSPFERPKLKVDAPIEEPSKFQIWFREVGNV